MKDTAKAWDVFFTPKAEKMKSKLPEGIQGALDLLRAEMEDEGPFQANWPHYGKLKGRPDTYHCHLNKGKPRYVAVWQISKKTIRLIEITFAGTHENVNYSKD